MFIIKSPSLLRRKLLTLKKKGKTIGFVPTMGSLHEGHLSLIRKAKRECDITVISIFVNPAQFGPGEDFERYPRDISRDKKMLLREKADYLFLPSNDAMYREGHSVYVEESEVSRALCGSFRPGHFRGVLTVVAKLFNIVQPHRAYFGQKDLQQAYLIRKMAAELDFPLRVVVCPTVREKSGLAMSSRNMYLSDSDRKRALCLKSSLDAVVSLAKSGVKDAVFLKDEGLKIIRAGSDSVDYLDIVSLPELSLCRSLTKGGAYAVLCAARIGATRLIDNMIFKI
jgi:pantoate--beta-alanine ligase